MNQYLKLEREEVVGAIEGSDLPHLFPVNAVRGVSLSDVWEGERNRPIHLPKTKVGIYKQVLDGTLSEIFAGTDNGLWLSQIACFAFANDKEGGIFCKFHGGPYAVRVSSIGIVLPIGNSSTCHARFGHRFVIPMK